MILNPLIPLLMKKHTSTPSVKALLFMTLAFVSANCLATHISPESALARYNKSSARKSAGLTHRLPSLKHDATIGQLYVFSSANGFVILPADDEAPALLAFSDNNSFDTQLNPALEDWLNFYNEQLSSLADR